MRGNASAVCILRGAKPGELPFEQPTRKTSLALRVSITLALLVQGAEVIR